MKRNKCSSLTSSDSVLSYTYSGQLNISDLFVMTMFSSLVILVVSLVHLNLA